MIRAFRVLRPRSPSPRGAAAARCSSPPCTRVGAFRSRDRSMRCGAGTPWARPGSSPSGGVTAPRHRERGARGAGAAGAGHGAVLQRRRRLFLFPAARAVAPRFALPGARVRHRARGRRSGWRRPSAPCEPSRARTGTRAVLVRSNLREHPTFGAVSWERSHGGALAAVGHLLTGHCGDFLISATLPRPEARFWGSHWRRRPAVVLHQAARAPRGRRAGTGREAARAPSDELVRRHLRVCWENRSSSPNCCRCDKCLVTMVALEACGQLDHFQTFRGASN